MARVLITNDDGIGAPGIHALAAAVRAAGFEVVVAAPAAEASGMSAALNAVTDHGRVLIEATAHGYAVAASPAYITVLGMLGVFGPPPEIVLSGINRGANTGRAVLHSGTVGAALTAANRGARALAVSLDVIDYGDAASGGAAFSVIADEQLHWDTAAAVAAGLLDWLAESPPGTVANVNVPDRVTPPALRSARLATFGQVRMAVTEQGADFARVRMERHDLVEEGSDVALLAQGYATVTALQPVVEAPGVVIPGQRRSYGGKLI